MSRKMGSPVRVLVAQLGARNHYLTPIALARHSILERLYTDLYVPPSVGSRVVGRFAGLVRLASVRRLCQRSAPSIPPNLVTSFPLFGLASLWRQRRAKTAAARIRAYLSSGRRFCELILRRGLGDADAIYAFSSAALELLEYGRASGRLGVLDYPTAPILLDHRLVAEQQQRYPDWSVVQPFDEALLEFAERQREECRAADRVIAISTFVRRAIADEGVPAEKVAVIPLALASAPAAAPARGRSGRLRILFVGHESVRKGLPDLVEAIRVLGSSRIEARAIGASDLTPSGLRRAGQAVEVVGGVPRGEMIQHYAWADVFVFPSVCDTFGMVILEAMSAGLPVIATDHCAGPDVIREGVDGFLVPIHSPEAIAQKLELLARDRGLRDEMGNNARERAGEFNAERYAENLAGALRAAAMGQHVSSG